MTAEFVLVNLAQTAAQETLRVVVSTFVERFVKRGGKKNESQLSVEIAKLLRNLDDGALAVHVRDAYSWASVIQVQGMPKPLETADASISLRFAPVARRFRSVGGDGEQFEERDLIENTDNFLILGDPGSGKTTTIQRLVLSLFDESPIEGRKNDISFPVLVVCREVDWGSTDLISELLGHLGVGASVFRDVAGGSEANVLAMLTELLDAAQATVIIDGLDEISNPDIRSGVLSSLIRLGRLTQQAQIICSSRSGEAPHLEGFAIADLLPLSLQQVAEIAARRTEEADAFMEAVENSGAREFLDRPLFLNQLLTVYQTTAGLPDRPADLYRQLVRLLLHEWDEQRRVLRRSAYANFDASAKLDFLYEVSFRLTWRGLVVFTESELIEVYEAIAPRFGLPGNGARQIVREIESHAGIISETRDGFQFSHLTLQEYLCAECIVHQPMSDEVAEYLRQYPEVVAVAVALSSRPDNWLTQCIGRAKSFDRPAQADAFGRRLGLEQPRFTPSTELGSALLRLLSQASFDGPSNWEQLGSMPAVRESVGLARERFHFERTGDTVRYSRKDPSDDRRRITVGSGRIPLPVFEAVIGDLDWIRASL